MGTNLVHLICSQGDFMAGQNGMKWDWASRQRTVHFKDFVGYGKFRFYV